MSRPPRCAQGSVQAEGGAEVSLWAHFLQSTWKLGGWATGLLGAASYSPYVQLCIHFILNRPQLCSDLLHSCLQLVLQLVDQGFKSTTIYWCLTGKQKESVHLIRSFSKALVSTHHKPVSTPGGQRRWRRQTRPCWNFGTPGRPSFGSSPH